MDPFVTSDYGSNPVFLTYAVVNSIFIAGHVLSKSCQEYSGITKNKSYPFVPRSIIAT